MNKGSPLKLHPKVLIFFIVGYQTDDPFFDNDLRWILGGRK
jgi:hypothetical protein